MTGEIYRYSFQDPVPIAEVRYSFDLAVLAAEGVHGRAQVVLDAGFYLDEEARACVVDATTPVGKTVSQILTALLTFEFGEAVFTVERLDAAEHPSPARARSAR